MAGGSSPPSSDHGFQRASTSWTSWPPLRGNRAGWRCPAAAVQRVLGWGLPPATEAWAVHLAVAIGCGVLATGEVTHLSRPLRSGGGRLADQDEWEGDRRAALEILDRCGLTLGPGVLGSLGGSARRSTVQRLEEELDLVRGELRRSEEVGRAHAEAEAGRAGDAWRAFSPQELEGLGAAAPAGRRGAAAGAETRRIARPVRVDALGGATTMCGW